MPASVVTTRPVSFTNLSAEDAPDTTYDLPAGTVLPCDSDVQPDGRQYVRLPWGSAIAALQPGEWAAA